MSKPAFLFPGQGAQTVGMGRELAESFGPARDLFDQSDAILGYPLSELCFEGPAEKLNSTIHSQPALFVCSLAALERLRRDQPELVESCRWSAGLSLGEYTAMVWAGVMDFETGLRVVQRRGEAMQEAADAIPSGMVSILGLEVPQVERLCQEVPEDDEILQVANLLCPGNTVVSGSRSACRRVVEAAEQAGAMKAIPLAVAGAFHTPLMQPAVDKLATALQEASLAPPQRHVVSNVDAAPHDQVAEIRDLLTSQLVSPVQWEASMRRLLAEGVDQFYEIGPGRVLRGLLKRIDRKVKCESIAG